MDVHAGRAATRWGAPPAVARVAVLAVHGRGQSPDYLRGLADRIDLPDVLWLAPSASGSTWYPGRYTEPQADNEPHLTSALAVVDRARAALAAEGFGPDRLVLLGFSQGACLLAEHLVRGAEPCAGAALLTGAFLGPPDVPRKPAGDLGGMRVLVGLPAEDEWVSLPRAQETARLLTAMGASVALEVYDEPEHVVADQAIASTRLLVLQAVAALEEADRTDRITTTGGVPWH